MRSSKNNPHAPATNLPTLKIGSRVRCTDDGSDGRIVWANAVAVKIRWNDGEQVTWRRDSLAGRPITILAEHDEEQSASPVTPDASAQTEPRPEQPEAASSTGQGLPPAQLPEAVAPAGPATREPARAKPLAPVPSLEATEVSEAIALEQPPMEDTPTEVTAPAQAIEQRNTSSQQALGPSESDATAAEQPRKPKRKQAVDSPEKRLSALDAAALMLEETGQAMTCLQLIEAMSAKGYWTSPGGKTPQATLSSALLREITTKGSRSRFVKTQPGKFARTSAV